MHALPLPTTPWPPTAASIRLLQRLWRRLHTPAPDADERFLRSATDLTDLERRQRQLERGRAERFAALDPWLLR